jgi:hypothetical protein
MLRIAAQDEGSSIAGAFMPDLGSCGLFPFLRRFRPQRRGAAQAAPVCFELLVVPSVFISVPKVS